MLFGAGHTSVLYTSALNREHVQRFTLVRGCDWRLGRVLSRVLGLRTLALRCGA
jgi:hypothetical protein